MKEFLHKVPITTLIISYFFVCGGLYLIGFWSTFEIDITSFISLWDIPKSFVFPFALTTGFAIILQLINMTNSSFEKDEPEVPVDKINESKWRKFKRLYFTYELIFTLAFFVSLNFYLRNKLVTIYLTISGLLLGVVLVTKIIKSNIIKKYIPYYTLRMYLGVVFIVVPVSCFVIGKGLSLQIYNNYKIELINNYDPKSDSLKFVGFIGDKVVASSLDNKRLIFINQSSIEEIEFIKIRKEE